MSGEPSKYDDLERPTGPSAQDLQIVSLQRKVAALEARNSTLEMENVVLRRQLRDEINKSRRIVETAGPQLAAREGKPTRDSNKRSVAAAIEMIRLEKPPELHDTNPIGQCPKCGVLIYSDLGFCAGCKP